MADRFFGGGLIYFSVMLLAFFAGIAELFIRGRMLAPTETWGGLIAVLMLVGCIPILCALFIYMGIRVFRGDF